MRLDFLFFLLLRGRGRGRGVEVGFFFPPSFEMWKEEGKGVIFSLIFFIVEWLRKGKVFFFYKFIMGGKVG